MENQDQFNITDPRYWLKINPLLNIGNAALFADDQSFEIDKDVADHLEHKINKEGYCQYHVKISDWQLPLEVMRNTVCELVGLGLLPVFALVYDEFWVLFLRQRKLLERFLGENYLMMPAGFWVWHVDPKRNEAGWDPHRDYLGIKTLNDDGGPNSLTVWIPLSNATHLNACMHVLPVERDLNYNKNYGLEIRNTAYVNPDDWRAVPAKPGDVLFWNHEIFHWGGATNPAATEPRISIATEFQRADINMSATILMDKRFMPSFERRLQLIAKLIYKYSHMQEMNSLNMQHANSIIQMFGSI